MSTAPVFIVHEGKLENADGLEGMGLSEGSRLLLASATADEIVLRREPKTWMSESVDDYMAGWKSLRGALLDGKDTTQERAREKAAEAEREQRKFGG